MPSRKKLPAAPIKIHGRQVEMVPVDDLKKYPTNARLHPEDQLAALQAIILNSGFTAPLIIDPDNGIIAGHGRALVAKRLGMDAVPCVRVTGLSATQVRALRLSDNQAALRSEWDQDALLAELTALLGDGFDIALTAFGNDALAALKVPGFGLDEVIARAEDTPPPPARPKVKLGELWQLGDHRLLIGDSTRAEDVGRLLDGAKPHLMVTDPPYGVDYDPNWRNEADRANGKAYGARAIGTVQNDGEADWTPAWQLFNGDVAYVWHADRHASTVQRSLESAGLVMRSQIIWAKDRLIISRGDYHWMHEPCWYAVRKGKKGHWAGDRKQTTLWSIEHRKSETGHGTQKPIECMRRPIINNSKKGDAVYDPFLGSGTTLIACEMEGRKCAGLEIDPAYAEVIITRWEKFTGKTARREDGKTLATLTRKKAPAHART